ncbi:glycosyltransferase family 4 protein [Paenibacillus xerothermodurans]|uniref:Glycosyltransferase family 1 protein n=1 Tax=Paenibacillus xerothermodurans TaxID=1977292 RepID=A0A2W1NMC8_PAEXE|nr:glycosyltransferase family 4 protein [Paenibacillus xerothermodurans]PZE20615.1 glycosyltransferase family 1 protein [Paenibacillus xerothermodurans]
MRILLTSFLAKFPHVGGMWQYVSTLKEGLERRGHVVDLFSMTNSQYLLSSKQGLQQIKINSLVSTKFQQYFHRQWELIDPWIKNLEISRSGFALAASYFGIRDYDVIHAQDVFAARAFQRIAEGIPLVATIHGSLYQELFSRQHDFGAIRRKYVHDLEHAGSKLSDCAIMPSHWLANIFQEMYHLDSAQFTVIPNGLDIAAMRHKMMADDSPPTVAAAAPVKEDQMIFICPARLVTEKGHRILLEALRTLGQQRQNWLCWIVGDGPLQDKLVAMAEDLSLQSHVQFLGNRSDVPALLRKADAVVLPSLIDNCPYAILEAMAAGKPVVASAAGGIPEMIEDGCTGVLFPTGDSRALSEKLQFILSDRTVVDRMVRNAKQRLMQHHTLDIMVARTLAVYQQSIMKHSGGHAV